MKPTLLALLALAAPAAADTITVTQVGFTFSPANITIQAGDTVHWVWTSGVHTVSEGTDLLVDGDEAFHEIIGAAVLEYWVTFDVAFLANHPRVNNRYDYFCEPHKGLNQKGSVTVEVDLPSTYCTAKPSSAGCSAVIQASDPNNQPVSGAGGYSVDAALVHSFKSGILFAGISGPAAIPFSGGTLCVAPPNKRGPLINSGGSVPNVCDGSYATFVNDGLVIPFGLDAGAGNSAWYQYWYRDPANGSGSLGTALSNALQLDFQ